MNYAALQQADYRTYCKKTAPWWWPFSSSKRISVAEFKRVHAACLMVVADRPNAYAYVTAANKTLARGYGADWIDFAIEAVLAMLKVPEEQRKVWAIIIRFVLQILISSLLVAQSDPSFGMSEGRYNHQVTEWAAEAEAELR